MAKPELRLSCISFRHNLQGARLTTSSTTGCDPDYPFSFPFAECLRYPLETFICVDLSSNDDRYTIRRITHLEEFDHVGARTRCNGFARPSDRLCVSRVRCVEESRK